MSTAHHHSDQALRLKQLEAELEIAHQQLALAKKDLTVQQQRLEAKRQEFIREHGPELLALIEGDPRAKVFITPVVEKLQNERPRRQHHLKDRWHCDRQNGRGEVY